MNLMQIRVPKYRLSLPIPTILWSRRRKVYAAIVIHINCPTHSLGGTTITWVIKPDKYDEIICLSMWPTEAEL